MMQLEDYRGAQSMLVYEGVKSGFINDVDLGIIADKIRNKYIEKIKSSG